MNRILIISNRVLSETDNNGKTLYSFVKDLPRNNVSQLYFYGNKPRIKGYNYFQLSDKDILKGQIKKSNRGRHIQADETIQEDISNTEAFRMRRSEITLLLRELAWKGSWRSPQLEAWLNEVNPEIVFFMAGDSLYAYKICESIIKKYNSKLITYVTDDYVLPRVKESVFGKIRRSLVKKALANCLNNTHYFLTISERMRVVYRDLFNIDSKIAFNMPDSLFDVDINRESLSNERIEIVYAGSLYYGRDDILLQLKEAIDRYNKCDKDKKIRLRVFTNAKPSSNFIDTLEESGNAIYGKSLNSQELKREYNLADILVFAESFDNEQAEKTRLSFSTKIPEYLSTGKPILAIGPHSIGSMDVLEKYAVCAFEIGEIEWALNNVVDQVGILQKDNMNAYDRMRVEVTNNCNFVEALSTH